MKHKLLFLLLFSASFYWNCNKFEATYTLHCAFTPLFVEQTLVVTDYKGNVIGQETLAQNQSSFDGTFVTHDADSPEYYDVHLISNDPGSGSYWIYSCLGVYNGSAVVLNPNHSNSHPSRQVSLYINGIETFSSLKGFELAWSYGYSFESPQQRVFVFANLDEGAGMVLRMKANGEPVFRQLFLSDSLLTSRDTVDVEWSDFHLESDPQSITFGSGLEPATLKVDAVSPDYQHFVNLMEANGSLEGYVQHFNRPDGLPANWLYRVSCLQNGVFMDRFFAPEKNIVLEKFDENVDVIVHADGSLILKTDKNFDAIRLSGNQKNPSDPNQRVFWDITGRMSAFQPFEPPALKSFLPNWLDISKMFSKGLVRATNFDLYEYEQIQAGFPFILSERFAFPRSGYKELWKSY